MENQENQKNQKNESIKKKCKKCGSGFVYIRIKDNSIVCRSCGHIDKMEE